MSTPPALALFLCVALLCTACGEEPRRGEAPEGAAPEQAPAKEALLASLFEATDPETFEETLKAARAAKLSEQTLLEARFVFLVDHADYAAIGALSADLEKAAASFSLADSAIFSLREEFLAVVQYAHALAALERKDTETFKKHITEAFWLSPNQGAAFAPHIERLRLQEAMSKVRVDFERQFPSQQEGPLRSLGELAGDADHLLLHFWSPWSNECAAFLGDFVATAQTLDQHGIPVVSVLTESDPDSLPEAHAFIAPIKEGTPAAWILDHPKSPLTNELRILGVPTCVLIHKDGRVLFNGHPADDELWRQLQLLSPKLRRPEVEPEPLEEAQDESP